MGTLINAPKKAFEMGGARLAARIEVQLATGRGFEPYPAAAGGPSNEVYHIPWVESE